MGRNLEDRVALVTGGTRGIGRAISLELARKGANVVPVYFRNREAAEETSRLIEDEGVKAVPLKAHVGDEKQIDSIFERVSETFGRLDVFVSNAALLA
jgi:NAD(P)-dependent dehydrogenase (short-subunit alcohol dehydrogenase family)